MGGISGFGVTAGAHRFWCHRAYKAKLPLRILLMLAYCSAGQVCVISIAISYRIFKVFLYRTRFTTGWETTESITSIRRQMPILTTRTEDSSSRTSDGLCSTNIPKCSRKAEPLTWATSLTIPLFSSIKSKSSALFIVCRLIDYMWGQFFALKKKSFT